MRSRGGETVARSIKSVFEFSAERMAAELAQSARLIRSDAATEFPEATPTPMGAVKIGRLTLPARWVGVVAIAAARSSLFPAAGRMRRRSRQRRSARRVLLKSEIAMPVNLTYRVDLPPEYEKKKKERWPLLFF